VRELADAGSANSSRSAAPILARRRHISCTVSLPCTARRRRRRTAFHQGANHVKNLNRLKKQNVRSSEPVTGPTELSLDSLRQISGGTMAYAHAITAGSCVKVN
jgi:hypothetical protein